MSETNLQTAAAATEDRSRSSLSVALVALLRGVVYKEADVRAWSALMRLTSRVREYVAVLGLELLVDEAEGYAFLRGKPEDGSVDEANRAPRLVVRRQLSFPVSLLLALLRKRLAETDAQGGDTYLVLSRDQIVEILRLFLPETTNEARLVEQIDAHIGKVVELGFLRKLKSNDGVQQFEVRRVLKAFVDAQWLSTFDERLAAYRRHLEVTPQGAEAA